MRFALVRGLVLLRLVLESGFVFRRANVSVDPGGNRRTISWRERCIKRKLRIHPRPKRNGRDVFAPPSGLLVGIRLENFPLVWSGIGRLAWVSADAAPVAGVSCGCSVVRAAVARGLPSRGRAIRGGVRWDLGGCGMFCDRPCRRTIRSR